MSLKIKIFILVLSILTCVCVVFYLNLPNVTIDREPSAYRETITAMLIIIEQHQLSKNEIKQYLDNHNLWRIGTDDKNRYLLELSGEKNNWILKGIPQKKEIYVYSSLKRVVLFDFSKYQFPELRINTTSSVIQEIP